MPNTKRGMNETNLDPLNAACGLISLENCLISTGIGKYKQLDRSFVCFYSQPAAEGNFYTLAFLF